MLELYRENNLNPFSGLALIFIQLPIIIGLYWVFYNGGLPDIDIEKLYSFIPVPEMVNMNFLGLVDMGGRSLILAALAGATQYYQIKYSLPPLAKRSDTHVPTLKDDLARSMHMQMRYVMPVLVTVFAYVISAAVALYWITSNLFAIGQEVYMRKRVKVEVES
jgi:YidC/Oxa1 family membrane protein insertase